MSRRKVVLVPIAALVAIPFVTAAVLWNVPNRELAGLEERWRRDVEAEETRSLQHRAPVRGAHGQDDSRCEIEAALSRVASVASWDTIFALDARVWGRLHEHPDLVHVSPPEFEALRVRLAPEVAAVRSALSCGSVDPRFHAASAERMWKDDAPCETGKASGLAPGFVLEALRELEDGRPDEASRLLVDLWRLFHEVARTRGVLHFSAGIGLGFWGNHGLGVLLAEIVPSLDAAGCDELERELRLLEASRPSLADAVRRDRLVLEGQLARAAYPRALVTVAPLPSWAPVSAAKLPPVIRHRRAVEWREIDELYRTAEELLLTRPPAKALAELETMKLCQPALTEDEASKIELGWPGSEGWGRTRWALSCCGDHNGPPHEDTESATFVLSMSVADLTMLRAARLLVAARRFSLREGHWPSSHAEALGREPLSAELDGWGQPFTLETRPDGWLVVLSPALREAEKGLVVPSSATTLLLHGAPPPRGQHPERVSLDLRDVPIDDAVDWLGHAAGRTFFVEPDLRTRVTVALKDVPWRRALDALARAARCEIVELDRGDLMLRETPRVTLDVKDADVRTLIQLVANYSGRSTAIDPYIDGKETVHLEDVPWTQALETIASTSTTTLVFRAKGSVLLATRFRTWWGSGDLESQERLLWRIDRSGPGSPRAVAISRRPGAGSKGASSPSSPGAA